MSFCSERPVDIDRAPSRAGHRPQLKRTNATFNAFPDLPPIRTSTPQLVDNTGSDSDSSSDSEDDFKVSLVDLAPLCPPSPPSPDSASSESSSSSTSPVSSLLSQEEWERTNDGFAPPIAYHEPYRSAWPPTPIPQFNRATPASHYGWSNNALHEMKLSLWYKRQWVWFHFEQECRRVSSLSSETDGGAIYYYPAPPSLPPSRHIPWMSANGKMLPSSERVRPQRTVRSRGRVEANYYSPIFPRVGDLSDLRDPSCDAVDRKFFTVPSYKIAQSVYLSEMKALCGSSPKMQRAGASSSIPASPLAQSGAPESPASVYSQDCSPVLPSFTSTDSPSALICTAVHGLRSEAESPWRSRWAAIERTFPPPPSPPPPPYWLSHFISPPQPTPSSDETTLSDDATSPQYASPHDDTPASESSVADFSTTCVSSTALAADSASPSIAVNLPAPVPVRPVPSLTSAPRSRWPLAIHAEPVVRSPSPVVGMSRTLADELGMGGSDDVDVEGDADDGVRFSVARPPSRAGSPQFSFIHYDDSDDEELEL